jgi:cytochrome c-type biogenesis protein CcmE
MPKNIRFAIGAGLIVAAITYLIVTAVRNTAEYYLTVNEVRVRETELSGQMLRVAGRVQPASIGWDPTTLTLQFAIAQPPPGDGEPIVKTVAGTASADGPPFRVISRGQPKPDMFAAGRDVIVEGRLGPNNTIEARQVLTSCPSKYAPKQRK